MTAPENEQKQDKSELLTQKIADRLKRNRENRGLEGDETTDWDRAKKILRNPLARNAFLFADKWAKFIDRIESSWIEAALEGLVKDLQNLAIFDLLSIIANLSLIYGIIGFVSEGGERQKQRHYQAWEMINSAVGRDANSGRKSAIEDLWADEVNLTGLDIHKAFIPKLDLSYHCHFWRFRVSHQICTLSDRAFFQHFLNKTRADLQKANLQEANLWGAKLQEANLSKANLQEAIMQGANLQEADLSKANLQEAIMQGANLDKAIFLNTDLRTVEGLVRENVEGENSPLICNSPLPKKLELDKDRDCEKLPQLLAEKWPEFFPDIKNAEEYINESRQQEIE
ncbi:MAG: pentapeptide repeat-containing protein [Cyanobacteria bacterium P01_E01_bin.42]